MSNDPDYKEKQEAKRIMHVADFHEGRITETTLRVLLAGTALFGADLDAAMQEAKQRKA